MPAETHVERVPLTPDDVFALVRDRLVEVLEIDEATIVLEADLVDDLGADGLAVIELVEALEDELAERTVGFAVADDDLIELRTVGDVVDLVLAALPGQE